LRKIVLRIISISVIILLLSLYVVSFIFALLQKDYAVDFLIASIVATTIIPVLLYMLGRFLKLSNVDVTYEDKNTSSKN
jgi:magnesium-transporting ATPase (P-type)